jgi:predicted Zn finger-like uncharacterized protein
MKIECDKCSAKYSIADEKVRGKTFKIRCKKCSNVIIVRDKGVVSDANPSAAVDSGGPGWHLAINGETVGPMAEDEVRQRYAAGEIDKDTAVWQEGFDDWLPLGEIDAFSDLPAPGSEDPFAASANQDDYAVGMGRSVGMGAAAAVAATGTDGMSEPQSPRVSKLTGQRNENSVLFSLDSLQAMATGGAAAARPNVAAPSARASANPSKGLATSAPSSEGSGLIDIRSLGSMVGGGGMASASAAPQAAADDAALPSFGGGGFGGLAASPLISPTQVAVEAAAPPVVQQRSNAPLYIMMIVLILAVGGLAAFILLKKPEEPKTIVQEVPIVAPSVKDDDEDDKKKDDDEDDEKKDDEKKDDEKAAEEGAETEGAEAEGGVVGDTKDGTKAGVTKKSGGGSSGGSKKSGGTSGTADASKTGTSGTSGGSTKSGGSDAPSVDCILDPSKCGAAKKSGGGTSGGTTSGGSTDPGAPEKLSATDIKAGMSGVKDAAKACGPKHGAKPGEKVTVKLSFSGATGTVTKATPLDPHAGTPLGNCVAAALKNAKVIKFKTASQGASYGVTM